MIGAFCVTVDISSVENLACSERCSVTGMVYFERMCIHRELRNITAVNDGIFTNMPLTAVVSTVLKTWLSESLILYVYVLIHSECLLR